jgi:hypothetical protein
MKSKYTIAVCDILGFSRLVEEVEIDQIVEGHIAFFRKALHHSMIMGDFPDEPPEFDSLQDNSLLGLAWFSDTILIFTREDSDAALQELIRCLSWLIFETTVGGGTRIRCGVSYGEAFIDPANSLYIGQAIVDAYRMEQLQAWTGGALTSDAVNRVPEHVRRARLADWPLVPYEVPLKGEGKMDTLAIDWTLGIHDEPLQFLWTRKHPYPTEGDRAEMPDVYEKWLNTKRFHEEVCRWCRAAPE